MSKIIQLLFHIMVSFIKATYLKTRGAHIGRRVLIGKAKFKVNPNNLYIGDGVVIGDGVIFDKLASITIKDFVKIHNYVHIEGGRDGKAHFTIGYNSWVGKETILNCEQDITIESNVCIGHSSQLWTHGYFPSKADGFPHKTGKIIIKEGAWITTSCIILPSSVIGNGSIIGNGSVVTKNIGSHVFATGIPCKTKYKETDYRMKLTPEEKVEAVLTGCINNIKLQGGGLKQLDKQTWLCSLMCKRFIITFQANPEIWQNKKPTCIFTWNKLNQSNRIRQNTSVFILENNTYTKKSSFHEWVVIRSLLDSCTLRLKPTQTT